MIAGLVAGLLLFAVGRVLGEPQVDRAIAFETAMDQAKGGEPEPEIVSRATQAGLGLFTGTVVVGTALGGLFSLVFALLHGRLGGSGARDTAALLALAGFAALVVVPMIKYPANPPSIGNPDTIGLRTALYFEMIAVALAGAALATALARSLSASWGTWNANLAGLALFVALAAVAMWLMPTVDEVPEQFSAVLLWRFRMAALAMQAVMWTTIALVFGALARRLLEPAPPRAGALRTAAPHR